MSGLVTRTEEQLEDHFVYLQSDRNHRIIARERGLSAEYHPDVQARIRRCIDSLRRRMRVTTQEWDEWEQALYEAKEHQIASYNTNNLPENGDSAPLSPWDDRYRTVSDIDEQADIKLKGKAGRFMRLFSQRHEVVVRKGSSNTADTEIGACIADPCLIPDALAQKLGIASFRKSDTPNTRLRKKMSPKCIADLKQQFIDANPIAENNYRMLVMPDGRILYSSGNVPQEKDTGGFRLKAGIFTSYGAERKTYHQQGRTCGEISLLTDVVGDIVEFIKVLDAEWKKDTPDNKKQVLLTEAQRLSMIWQAHFHECVGLLKTDAEKCFEDTENLVDTSGKVNPSASMSKLVRAKNDLWKRAHDDIPAKGKYNWIDQVHLMRERKSHEKRLRGFRIQLQKDAPLLDSIRSDNDFERVINQFQLDPAAFSGSQITLQPFRFYADQMLGHYGDFTLAMDDKSLVESKRSLTRMHAIGKCQGFHSFLAHIHQNIILPQWSTVAIAQWNLRRMRKYLESKQVFPEITLEGYDDIFHEMLGALMKLEDMLGERDHFENDDEFFEALEGYIKQFNMPQMVRELR
ncbi:hypothetical protein KKG16_02655 [Patescibacteria group bacterium]|nr:hypothetical protein [Patescibacteria group bacterium]